MIEPAIHRSAGKVGIGQQISAVLFKDRIAEAAIRPVIPAHGGVQALADANEPKSGRVLDPVSCRTSKKEQRIIHPRRCLIGTSQVDQSL